MGAGKIASLLLVGIWGLGAGVAAEEDCPFVPERAWVGRDTGAITPWCDSQKESCSQLCGGSVSANFCDSDSYCYDCTCADGSTPPLEIYSDTIPTFICERNYQNCMQQVNMYAGYGNYYEENAPKCKAAYDCPIDDPSEAGFAAVAQPTTTADMDPYTDAYSTATDYVDESDVSSTAAATYASITDAETTTEVVTSTSTPLVTVTASSSTPDSSSQAASTSSSSSSSSSSSESSTFSSAARNATTSTRSAPVTRTTSSSSSSTTAASVTLSGAAAAVMTAMPWTGAAIGMVGLVMAGL
ncbi:hypothetical protein PVAG01_09271 [Phlyctema vagabunda]|uniref:DUF7707 domain-containing protein n=1 Tax=Phlyctema vagabunda TaxID=108571 RepID=A0ABR4P6Z4_9HELO